MRPSRAFAATSAALLLLGLMAPTTLADENRLPEGTHDGFDHPTARVGECYANGWAVDPDDVDTPVTVRILVDDEVVAEVAATEYRQDIVDAGIDPAGSAGFWVDLGPLGVDTDVIHTVLAQARDPQTNEWRVIDGSPRELLCTNLTGFHDGRSGVVGPNSCVAEGWAADLDAAEGPRAQVRVKVDGRVVAETTANEFREDVRDAGFGDGFSGWTLHLFGKVTPNVEHVITAEVRDTSLKRQWLPLFGTDRHLTCLADGAASVAGDFSYTSGSGPKSVQIDGRVAGGVRGSFRFTGSDGTIREGPLTCLAIDGPYAWAAGPETSTTGDPVAGIFFLLYDGGSAADKAVAFVADPGMTFEEDILPLCEGRAAELPLFDLDGGWLTVGAR